MGEVLEEIRGQAARRNLADEKATEAAEARLKEILGLEYRKLQPRQRKLMLILVKDVRDLSSRVSALEQLVVKKVLHMNLP